MIAINALRDALQDCIFFATRAEFRERDRAITAAFKAADESDLKPESVEQIKLLLLQLQRCRATKPDDGLVGLIHNLQSWQDQLLVMAPPAKTKAPRAVADDTAQENHAATPDELSYEAKAMAAIIEDRTLDSLAAVAKKIGCTPQYLTPKKTPLFRAAWKVHLEATSGKAVSRRGTRDKDGNLEAWSNETDYETDS